MSTHISCDLCYKKCSLAIHQIGSCGVRMNNGKTIGSIDTQKIIASHIDPIEKKPIYHFFPYTKTYSIGMLGCNLTCKFCQNSHISQSPYINQYGLSKPVEPQFLIKQMVANNSKIMSYTYSEPIVWSDYIIPIAEKVREAGFYNLFVTNGTFSETSLLRLSPLIDAINIDLKGDENFYTQIATSPNALASVLRSIEHFANDDNTILEVTTLIIEPIHTKKMIRELGIILKKLNVKVWHLSRFFPSYAMSHLEPTTTEYLEEMAKIAKDCGIAHIYLGNVSNEKEQNLTCPECGTLINRNKTSQICTQKGDLNCPSCNHKFYGKYNYPLL